MFKVIVERPRGYKGAATKAARLRNDFDGPPQLGMRAGYGPRGLNENLAPLRRYLRAQLGRPWNKVYAEIAATIDRRNTVQQHIYQHIDDFIAVRVEVRADGKLVDLGMRARYFEYDTLRQELYVDPRTGLIRLNKHYRSWAQIRRERDRAHIDETHARRRVIDKSTQLHLRGNDWFEVKLAVLPLGAGPRFDVLLKRETSRHGDWDERTQLYGAPLVYAVSKRQLSRREKKAYGLD
jgi:hypothetical protein